MRVALQHHELLDPLGAVTHHPPDVVAGQVDEHDVLGPLLGVFAQLGRHAPVVGLAATAAPGARDRPADHPAVEELHHGLRRRADERHPRVTHEVHVGRRVHLAKHPVHVEGVVVAIEVEALRQHDLEDVAGEDVLARHLDRGAVGGRRHRRAAVGQLRELARRWRGRRVRERPGELVDPRVEPGDGELVRVGRRGLLDPFGEDHVLDEVEALAEVVERGHVTHHAQHRVGRAQVVGGHVGQPLDLAYDVVAEVSDDAAVERGQVRDPRRLVRAEQGLERGERAVVGGHARRRRPLELHRSAPHDHREHRVAADEREPAPALGVLDRLQQEP